MGESVKPVSTTNSIPFSDLFFGVVQLLLLDSCGITIGATFLVAKKDFSTILTNPIESCLPYNRRVFQYPGP